jgi:hypothetical protein
VPDQRTHQHEQASAGVPADMTRCNERIAAVEDGMPSVSDAAI